MRFSIFFIILIGACKGEKIFNNREELFWPRFKNMYSVKSTNIISKKVENINDKVEIYFLKVNKSNNSCRFLKGNKLLGEYLIEIDIEKTPKKNKLTDPIFLKLFEGTELKYSLRMKITEVLKNEPLKWDISNLMNYPYDIKNDTLSFEYKYLNDD